MKKIALLILSFICSITNSNAQLAGDLDTSFGTNGLVNTNIGEGTQTTITAQALQNDGKIIITGNSSYNQESKTIFMSYIKRLNNDGTDDISFANSGTLITDNTTNFNFIKVQNDGKIVVAGGLKVFRFNADGSSDLSFHMDGYITANSSITGLDLQPDGKIILYNINGTGFGNLAIFLTRYTTSGDIDISFGSSGSGNSNIIKAGGKFLSTGPMCIQPDGKFLVSFSDINSGYGLYRMDANGIAIESIEYFNDQTLSIKSITLQPDGKIIAGDSKCFYRYNSNGSRDITFGVGGRIYNINQDIPNSVYTSAIKLQTSGKILIINGVYSSNDNFYNSIISRLNSDGSFDNTFNGASYFTIPTAGNNTPIYNNLNVYNNQIIVATNTNSLNKFGLISKINLNSVSLDTNFGNAGQKIIKIPPDLGTEDKAYKSLIQPDGKIIVVGTAFGLNDPRYITIVRYNSDGSIDTSFAKQGKYYNTTYAGGEDGYDICLQSDGKIILLTNGSNALYYYVTHLIRFNTDGTLDTTFGTNGAAQVVIPGDAKNNFRLSLHHIQSLPNHKMVLAGSFQNSSGDYNHIVVKLNANGSIDTSFNSPYGYETSRLFPQGIFDEGIFDMQIQNDGKIITCGYYLEWDANDHFIGGYHGLLIRHNPDGSIDDTFGTNGFYATDDFAIIKSMDIQNDGKIIINASRFSTVNVTTVIEDFLISRINSDGTLDTTFGFAGTAKASIENSCKANFVKVLQNQKILLGGYSIGTHSNFAATKFNTDGSIDIDFGNQGKVITDFNAESVANCVITNDNKLILAGYLNDLIVGNSDFAIAKYHVDTFLGTVANETSNSIHFYPNPTNDKITLNPNTKAVNVFSIDGKQFPSKLENNEVDLSLFSKGIYLIQITTDEGRMITKKLVKN